MAATYATPPLSQYSTATTGGTTPTDLFIRDVPDWTKVLRRQDTPLLRRIGGVKASAAPKVPMNKAEWGWGSLDPTEDTLAEDLDNSETAIDVANGTKYQVGLIITIDDEDILVSSVVGNTVNGTRGYRGTTATTHTNGATIHFVGIAIAENANDPLSVHTDGEVQYNYHEIFIFNWELSQRAKVTPTYESRNLDGNRFEQELKKKMNSTAPIQLERALIMGLRSQGNGSGVPSTFGGLRQTEYITTRTPMGGDPLTERDLLDTMQVTWQLVGGDLMPRDVMCGSTGKQIVSSWYNDQRRIQSDTKAIGVVIDTIQTDFGPINFWINYQLDALGRGDRMYALRPEDITLRPYDSSTMWKTGLIATDGWYDRGYLRGDFTCIWENPDSRFEIYGFDINKDHYPALA